MTTKASIFESHDDFLKRRTRRMMNRPLVTAEDISKLCNKTSAGAGNTQNESEMLQEVTKYVESEKNNNEGNESA